MRLVTVTFLIAVLAAASHAAESMSALSALKLLPPEKASLLCRIEGREGAPTPQRWYLLVYDPSQESAVQEFVVADGKVVATRSLSQFASVLTPEDVIGGGVLSIDSSQAFATVQSYARYNRTNVESLNYRLSKDSGSKEPVWSVKCISPSGKSIGEVAIAATDGRVIAQQGFAYDPPSSMVATAQRPGSRSELPAIAEAPPNAKPASRRQRNRGTPAVTARPAELPPDPVSESLKRFGERFRGMFSQPTPPPTPVPPRVRSR
jgi:hypothetical protein